MIKKLIGLAATALLSLNANAGYVQYNLTGSVSGYVIQHDNNGAIADYELAVSYPVSGTTNFFTYNSASSGIINAGTRFPHGGPTEFFIIGFSESVSLDFNVSYEHIGNNTYRYTAHTNGGIKVGQNLEDFESMLYGVASKGIVDSRTVALLDESGGFAPNVTPVTPVVLDAQQVPEPASLALFGIAALGMGAYRYRRTAQSASQSA